MIYLDNAATTRMYEEAVRVYNEYAVNRFFNPSASYQAGLDIAKQLNEGRNLLLKKLGAKKGTIIFTGGATESNNLAIRGSMRNGKYEYAFSVGEHPSVYNVAKELKNQGHIVHFVDLRHDGQVDYQKLEKVLNEKTRLISVMHISNETGAINDLAKIDMLRKKNAPNALFHVDGVQAFCKVNVNVDKYNIDFYTISAHKFHGPKGVGALYVRNSSSLKNIVFGGGQENGFRSGTENVAGIMAMLDAVKQIDIDKNFEYVCSLSKKMTDILDSDENVEILQTESPYILSVGFKGVNGETLMRALQDKGVIVGIGSACSAKKAGNRVLESLGYDKERVKSHIRISFSEDLQLQDIEKAGKTILQTYREIWEKVK